MTVIRITALYPFFLVMCLCMFEAIYISTSTVGSEVV